MTMQVRTLSGGGFPYRWTKAELPHTLDCGISVAVDWASMSEISQSVWVSDAWQERLQDSWDDLETVAWNALSRKGRLSQGQGSRVLAPRGHEKIDHCAITDALPDDNLSYQIGRHRGEVRFLLSQISDERGDNLVEITPAEWLTLRGRLRVFGVPVHHWSAEQEERKYDVLLAFLMDGKLPEGVSMGADHIPSLTQAQAAGVLWFLNTVTGLDVNDIRYGPCAMCGDFCTSEETSHCAGCEVSMCECCFESHSGREEHDPQWPDWLAESYSYCEKCVAVVEDQLKEKQS